MDMPIGHRQFGPDEVLESLTHQALEGDWTRGFTLRSRGDDPWDLNIFGPDRVAFAAPEEHRSDVVALRQTILELVRPFFISEESWDRLRAALTTLYTNPELCAFMEERRGNLFLITPHVQFHDLGILAASSMAVRAELPKGNPFAAPDNPARNQSIVANRVLSVLDHGAFHSLTGLPIFEGLMLPLADVVTTISANGSGRLARMKLGPSLVSALNDATRAHLVQMTTRGSQIIMLAPSGSQAQLERVDRYSEALVIGQASRGTAELIVELNLGEPITRRNVVAGVFLDCPSIGPDGQITAQEAGVAVCPDVWVPTKASELASIMKATIRTGVGRGRLHGAEFRYGRASQDAILRRSEITDLDRTRLTEVFA
jgi:hypothetical protein